MCHRSNRWDTHLQSIVQSTARSSVETPSFLPSHPAAGFGRDWPGWHDIHRESTGSAFRGFSPPLLSGKIPRWVITDLRSSSISSYLFRICDSYIHACICACVHIYVCADMCTCVCVCIWMWLYSWLYSCEIKKKGRRNAIRVRNQRSVMWLN